MCLRWGGGGGVGEVGLKQRNGWDFLLIRDVEVVKVKMSLYIVRFIIFYVSSSIRLEKADFLWGWEEGRC